MQQPDPAPHLMIPLVTAASAGDCSKRHSRQAQQIMLYQQSHPRPHILTRNLQVATAMQRMHYKHLAAQRKSRSRLGLLGVQWSVRRRLRQVLLVQWVVCMHRLFPQ